MVVSRALTTLVNNGQARMQLADVALPEPQENQLLIRNHCVAQNPTDVQSLDTNAFGEGAVLGCDFVGQVELLGKNVTSFKNGDRVAGLIWGGEIRGIGAYSDFTFADEKICFKVPETIRSEDAATVPLASATAFLALYSPDCLAIERNVSNPSPVLVWGGSSSVGSYAIQLATAFSIPVVAVCSRKHFELCKNMGASYVYDYHDDRVVENIKSAIPNIKHVFDCIGTKTSSTQSSETVSDEGGIFCTVRPGKAFTENIDSRVTITDVLVWTSFLKDHQYGSFRWPASISDHELASELFQNIPGWLMDGTLTPNKSRVLPGGFDAVEEGFQMYRKGEISGFKIVYNLLGP